MTRSRGCATINSLIKHSFAPIVGPNPRVLILGSLPGDASLKIGQYYGHPRNRFWDLVGAALKEDLRALPYAKRVSRLKARGVALWDVVSRARRRGSLDADIRDEHHNLVLDLIHKTRVTTVFLNGNKAAVAFSRACPTIPNGLTVVKLPSSSPANAAIAA